MGSKRLIFTVTNDLSNDRRMQRICRSLAANGNDVTLTGRILRSSKVLDKETYKQKRLRCFFNSGKLFYLEFNLRLLFFLLFTKSDAICSTDTDTLTACGLAAIIKNKKLVFDAHEYFTEVPEVVRRPFVKYTWALVEKIFIKRAQLRYTVSESIANAFENKLGTGFNVIQNVPETFELLKKEKPEKKYLVYQGALNEGRGLEALINAIKLLNENIKLYIAGEGDLSVELRNLVKEKKLEDRVIFLGMLKPNELIPLMQSAFAGYNLLEKKGLSYYWALNNKFFDYIHAEIPVLTPPFPEFKKILEKFEVGPALEVEADQIAFTINNMLEDKELYAKYKDNCKKAKAEYNWEKESLKLTDLYEQLFK